MNTGQDKQNFNFDNLNSKFKLTRIGGKRIGQIIVLSQREKPSDILSLISGSRNGLSRCLRL